MSDFTLTLGGVTFSEFEIPDEIAAGGGQLVAIHKYGGGSRTVDAFGSDDDPITWSGIFFDSSAEPRCQQIDAMRKAGAPVSLSWSSFSYQVVITKFNFKYQRFYQIPYSIELQVVQDNVQPSTDDGDDLESDIQGDLDDATGFSDEIGDGGLASLMDGITAAATSVQSIVNAPLSFLSGFSGQISGALSYAGGLADTADTEIAAILPIPSGSPSSLVSSMLSMAGSDTESMATTFAMKNTLGRLLKNVNSITG